MGFSGGGGSQTLPHTHDSNIANDGGALQFNNVTQGSMAAGDVTYSDGSHLQVLSYPAVPAGETLSAPALSTAPEWAAGGGTWTNEGSDSGDDVTNLEVSVSDADIYHVIWCASDQNAATTTLTMRLNNISTSTYDTMKGTLAAGGTMGGSEYSAIPKWLLSQQGGGGKMNSGYATVYKANSDFTGDMAVGATFVANNMQNTTAATPNNNFNTGMNSSITGAITTITLEYINDGSTTRQNITGSMQVNSMSY